MALSDLQADIADWLHRDDITSATSLRWVTYATAAFNRDEGLRVPEMESRDEREIDSEYSALPDDFLAVRSLVDDEGRQLRYLASQQFTSLVASQVQPDPPIYTIEDFQLRVLPAPTASEPLTLTLSYYERIGALALPADTNWLLDEHPDLYLYGALIHARAWLHDEPRLAVVKQLYDEGLAQLKRRRVHSTGIVGAPMSDVPLVASAFDIRRGY